MPSLRSLGPTVKPSSSLCTMNAEMPLAPLSGSVTAITVYQVDLPPFEIQHLDAVEDPVVAVGLGPGAHRRGIAAGLALRQRVGRHRFARADRGQHLLLEFLGAAHDQAHGAQLVDSRDQRRRRAHPGDLLDHDARRDGVRTLPAVLLGNVHREKPDAFSAANASSGYRAFSSTSAAYGAISFSHRSRSTARISLCSSGSWKTSKDGLPSHGQLLATRQ